MPIYHTTLYKRQGIPLRIETHVESTTSRLHLVLIAILD